MGTPWRGLLVPLDVPTGDQRRVASAGLTVRQLPLPLKWQRSDESGHDKSVVVGSLTDTTVATVDDAVAAGWISAEAVAEAGLDGAMLGLWGTGEQFDDADPEQLPRLAEDVAEANLLLQRKVIGPSIDPSGVVAVDVAAGADTPLTEEDWDKLLSEEEDGGMPAYAGVETLYLTCEVGAATLVAVPAFAQCRPFELGVGVPEPELALTAAVRSGGWGDMPLAGRDREWDADAASAALASHCSDDGDIDFDCYARGFLHRDDDANPDTQGAYGFGIVDVVDGDMVIVPRAVFAVAAALQGARGGTTISQDDQDSMRRVVNGLYERMADEFGDPGIVAPWQDEDGGQAAARRKKRSCSAQDRYAQVWAAQALSAPVCVAEWFDPPDLDGYTPITVTDDGQVFGHVASHAVCHAEHSRVCLTAPVDTDGYSAFHRHLVDTSSGPMAVGRLTYGAGKHPPGCLCCLGKDDHACDWAPPAAAMSHYDAMTTVAWVRAFEDVPNNAIVVAGVINPAADVDAISALSRARVSGDWRRVGVDLSLIEVLVLSSAQPGFPPPRARAHAGRVMALTAAGAVRPPSSPRGRIDADDVAWMSQQVVDAVSSIVPAAVSVALSRARTVEALAGQVDADAACARRALVAGLAGQVDAAVRREGR